MGAFKFAFGNFGAANASGIVRPENGRIVIAKIVQQAPVNAAPLPDVQPLVLPPVITGSPPVVAEPVDADQIPAELTPPTLPASLEKKTANRRDGAVLRAQGHKRKNKVAKDVPVASKDQPTAEPKPCQLEDFDALRWAFSLPTGCHT
jgi:hypothetical protein